MAIGANLGVCAGPRGMRLLNAAPLAEGHGLPSLPQVDYVIVRAGPALSDLGQAFAEVLKQAARRRFRLADDPFEA